MKVLLINPAQRISNGNRFYKSISPTALPLGLAYLAAVLEKNNIKVFIVDQYANGINNDEVVEVIQNEKPQLIGISCLTPAIGNTVKIINKIRSLKKPIKIVLGNTHATVFSEQLLREKLADFIVRGEGEFSLLDLVLSMKNSRSPKDVKGISFFYNGKVIHNPDRFPLEDLDTLPYPAYHLFNLELYSECSMLCIYDKFLPIQASRGCVHRCTFCSQDKVFKKIRKRKIINVVDEIQYMQRKFNVNYFVFQDASFPLSVDSCLEFCDEVIKRGLHKKIKWVTEMRVDLTNPKLFSKMKQAGLRLILYGFEFGNQHILDIARKGTTLQQAYKAMECSKKAGISTFGLFMLGMPGESRQTCLETIKFAKKLNCDIAKFNIAIPLPGSEFFNKYKDKIKDINSFENFISWSDWANGKLAKLPYVPEGMTEKELFNLQRKAMFEFYCRPIVVINIIIKKLVPFKKLLWGGIFISYHYLCYLIDKITNKHIKHNSV